MLLSMSRLLVLLLISTYLTTFAAEFSPPSLPFATAHFNLASEKSQHSQVKLPAGVKRGSDDVKGATSQSFGCTLELQVVQRLSGMCIDFGRSNACSAGAYIYPFHPECINGRQRQSQVRP
ncbi:uncharacterized protein LOC132198764 [Neocloeon triangulifer]|uniref:uncharacterized protein LOC132198764 n=1 Tax=Neocloeon triangulifer TaxID=2078957 RepID=UPI00286F7CE3|nr:uncharacterized protein LOC132198764 [Neocloeon triangulifer]